MIEVERAIDELTYERFHFSVMGNTLYLNNYYLFKKENKRSRKWVATKKYDRLFNRNSTIKESDVELTISVKTEALEQFIKTISCKKWSERLR